MPSAAVVPVHEATPSRRTIDTCAPGTGAAVSRRVTKMSVFCGLNPGSFGAKRMLAAGHIKPWKDSTSAERLDLRNGLAACPSHDVAFDTGLVTVDASLQVHVSGVLTAAVGTDPLTRQYYGRPPLLDTILLPDQAQLPGRKYLVWHRTNIFVA